MRSRFRLTPNQAGEHMAIRRLERSEWPSFCLRASRYVLGKRAEIEALSLEIGRQVAALRMPILGIDYDPRSDVMQILLTDLEHLIYRPRELYVDDRPEGLLSFEGIDGDGVQQIIVLSEPLMLPAPRGY